jgi:hypothetical protein
VDKNKLTPGAIVILASAVVMLIASFLDFYKGKGGGSIEIGGVEIETGISAPSVNAWGEGQFLIVSLVVLLALAAGILVALLVFGGIDLPDRVLSLTWNQVLLALGFQATIMMIANLIRSTGGFYDRGIGLFLMLLAAIGLLVGAILREREAASPAPDPGTPPNSLPPL